MPLVAGIMALMIIAYFAIGLFAGALVLVFRTSGPLTSAVIAASGLLGGVYYSTSVIPSWLQHLSAAIPLTYALRAIRMLLLGGAPAAHVVGDVTDLAIFAAGLLLVAIAVFVAALRHARVTGTLSQY
jgi:ABC-2 type transport system permease protein